MNHTEHFQVEGFMRWVILASPWIFAALVVLGLSLPLLPDEGRPRNEDFQLGFSIFMATFFSVLAVLSWRMVRELPYAAVSVDSHGIWRSVEDPSTSLVRWKDISRIRERHCLPPRLYISAFMVLPRATGATKSFSPNGAPSVGSREGGTHNRGGYRIRSQPTAPTTPLG